MPDHAANYQEPEGEGETHGPDFGKRWGDDKREDRHRDGNDSPDRQDLGQAILVVVVIGDDAFIACVVQVRVPR